MPHVIDPERCIACGNCAQICPVEAPKKVEGQVCYKIDPDACIDCGNCAVECPVECIKGPEI